MQIIPTTLSKVVARQALTLGKHAPDLLFAGGVMGVVGSTVLACRSTLKLDAVLTSAERDVYVAETIRDQAENPELVQEAQSDIVYAKRKAAKEILKLYGPAIVLGGASIFALTKSHSMLKQRNLALSAAYAAVAEAFDEYRQRVREKYGDEEDRKLRYASEFVDIVDGETGEVISVLKVSPDAATGYARFFDHRSTSWSPDPEVNFAFARAQQEMLNWNLQHRGHVFLNEAYDAFGIARTRAGQVMGWVLDGPDSDNYVDLGINDLDNNRQLHEFLRGEEDGLLLDFNVTNVYDQIGK